MTESAKKKNVFTKIGEFFKGLRTEFKKISWPTLPQTAKQTLVVIVISALLCGFIRLIDIGAQYAVSFMSTIVK